MFTFRSLKSWIDTKQVVTGIICLVIGLMLTFPASYVGDQKTLAVTNEKIDTHSKIIEQIELKLDDVMKPSEVASKIDTVQKQVDDLKRIEAQHHQEVFEMLRLIYSRAQQTSAALQKEKEKDESDNPFKRAGSAVFHTLKKPFKRD